jgi:hypothetical protein
VQLLLTFLPLSFNAEVFFLLLVPLIHPPFHSPLWHQRCIPLLSYVLYTAPIHFPHSGLSAANTQQNKTLVNGLKMPAS